MPTRNSIKDKIPDALILLRRKEGVSVRELEFLLQNGHSSRSQMNQLFAYLRKQKYDFRKVISPNGSYFVYKLFENNLVASSPKK